MRYYRKDDGLYLSQLQKLLNRVRNNPKTVRFEELDKILISEGFKKRQPRGGSSHYTYTKGNRILTVPHKRPYILEKYVELALEAIGDCFEE